MVAHFPPKVEGDPRGIRSIVVSEAVNAVAINAVSINAVAINAVSINAVAINAVAINAVAINAVAISEAVRAVISPEGANVMFVTMT